MSDNNVESELHVFAPDPRGAGPRLRGRRLQQRRESWFARFPLCVRCLCKQVPAIVPATELDHVVPLFKGGVDNESNLQGLCADCHAAKTLEDMRGSCAKVEGYDDSGWPIPKVAGPTARAECAAHFDPSKMVSRIENQSRKHENDAKSSAKPTNGIDWPTGGMVGGG